MRYFIDARIIVLSAVAVFFISASPVCAQTQKGVKNASGGTDKFAAADTNGDGGNSGDTSLNSIDITFSSGYNQCHGANGTDCYTAYTPPYYPAWQ